MKHVILCIIILLLPCCFKSYKGELIFVEPGNLDPFNFPYFLFIPENVPQNEEVFMLIEPNNSGFVDDDLQKHIEKAERAATNDFYLGSYVAQDLQIPILVPVFPRARSDWKVYTHALDRDVMLQKGNSLERIDLQMIEMFHDARSKLKERNIQTKEQFLLTGFSASGSFANRFTLMHPEKVRAVAAGGVNGLLMLPLDSIKDEAIKFPIGTADLPQLINKEFHRNEFLNIPQFYFMGELDENDAIPYDDAYSEDEREQIYRLLGKEMQPARWNMCKEMYIENKVNAVIKTYENTGHEQTENIKRDVVNFFGKNIFIYGKEVY